MGIRYAFSILTEATRVDALLEALAEVLAPANALALRAALPWRPLVDERLTWGDEVTRGRLGVAGIGTPDVHDACFSYVFREDAEVQRYLRTMPGSTGSVGCVYTRLEVGERFACLTATAATSGMSRLFAASRGVSATFERVAVRARAFAVLFDDESDHDVSLVWPGEARRVPTLVDAGGYPWSRVDEVVAEQLRLAGLRASENTPRPARLLVVCDLRQVDVLLSELASRLVGEDASALRQASPWRAARSRRFPWATLEHVWQQGIDGLSEGTLSLRLLEGTSIALRVDAGEYDAVLSIEGPTDALEKLASVGALGAETVLLDDGDATTQRRLWPGSERRVARPDEAAFRGGSLKAIDVWAGALAGLARR
ncbi:MAG: hypothetical protein H6721_08730 [Sandaracinus sp.]|nr:hypothetical protein [Myxococcales bacterium]MCB9613309.1 hypothetical protein [Sandaracinus sp.]MCB9632202.1 hypothetical protein [Sandaracinus sp.]